MDHMVTTSVACTKAKMSVVAPPTHLDSPVFVLCAARSGSTLLQSLLDSHPAIFAPPETNFSAAAEAIHFLCHSVCSEDEQRANSRALAAALSLASSVLDEECRCAGKTLWCDKSLTTLGHLELIQKQAISG